MPISLTLSLFHPAPLISTKKTLPHLLLCVAVVVARYVGHAFRFVSPSTKTVVIRLEMRADTTMYLIPPADDDFETLQSETYIAAVEQVGRSYLELYLIGISLLSG
jgi:hypothetical protein